MVKEHVQKLTSGLWQLQQSGRFCDTVVVVSGNAEIQAHAAVLAAASDWLCCVLQENRSDNTLNHGTSQFCLDITQYDKAVVTTLLEYIYTGEIIAFTSLNCSVRDDLAELCTKFGITITMDEHSADNGFTTDLPKNITDCHLTESADNSHYNCRCSNASEKVEVASLNKVPGTATDSDTLSVYPPSHQCDHTVSAGCSSAHGVVCDLSSNADQSPANIPVGSEAAGKHEMLSRSALGRRSSKVRKRKQSHDGTRLVRKKPLNCSSCSRTFTPCGHSEQDSDPAERLNCPHCQHLCVPVTGVNIESKKPEAIIKAENGCSDACSTVDTSQLRPDSSDVAQKQEKQSSATQRASGSVDGKSLRRWHQCNVCSRRCSTAAALKSHEQVHAEGSSRSTAASCKTCGKKFRHRSYLRYHERLHEGGDRPFVCDVCGKGFIGSSSLTNHRRTHSGDRPYACSICHKRFFQLCAVREHEKIHIGIKMFVCDVCGKQFMTQAQLFNHSRTHGGEKSFECEVCRKRFYTNGDLVKHARIHADRRPFVCDVCGKGFKYSSNLHGHSRIHTGSRPFPCQTCGKAFTYSSHLTRHVKMHTRNSVILEDAEATMTATSKDELSTQPAVTPSTDNIVSVSGTTPSAILFVQPELLLGAPQVATNILPGFPISSFTARLCN